ncbi:hypothetical protein GON26_00980 [Flavobacterium sp. GA093]|uniref:Uncharacterized protein n=1 Tax=Flavobacterium hydrocarbonoxydans TaxID=2683249 RepID=A0A6I4NPA9_9FLAO|nr:ankyrin repeat domain-containing protein [Flavobacterium hydrocarbonoxydans]MWB92927.1 hypothetical protein [Flavobacterium hydrocarbonoxydans]
MKKELHLFYLILFFTLSQSYSCRAAEFPWFNIKGFEGWVEYTTNISAERRINVLPKLFGPSGIGEFGGANVDMSKLISIKSNGDLVIKYLVLSSPSKLPANFKEDVARSIIQSGFNPTGFNANSLHDYQIVIPKITNIVATLIVDGVAVRTASLGNTFTSSEFIGEFRFNQDDDNYAAIYNGDFKIVLEYKFPYQNFSSLSLKLSQSSLTNIKVDVFREVIRKAKSSGSKMWFIDTRKQTIKTIEKERISTTASSTFSSNVDIVLRDPDETILAQLESLLGYQQISKAELLNRHQQLQTIALASGNLKLGELSEKYIKALNSNDEPGQIDILASLAALQKGDILSFFASGVSVMQNSSSTNYTYTASVETSINTESSDFYTTTVIKTIDYNYHVEITDFPYLKFAIQNAENTKIVEVFGSPTPSILQINDALLNSVETNNLINLKYSILKGGDPNFREPVDYNPLLNIAILRNRAKLVSELLISGANPNLDNRHGENAILLAENSANLEIKTLVSNYKNRSGVTNLKINLDNRFSISDISLNLNGRVVGYKPKYDPEKFTWSIENIKEYPALYNMNAIITIWTIVKPEQNNQIQHNKFISAGFISNYSNSGYTYTKQLTLFDRIKIINGGSNTYNYQFYFDPINFSMTEINGKSADAYKPVQNPPLSDVMFNFEK